MRELNDTELDNFSRLLESVMEQCPERFVEMVNGHLKDKKYRLVLVNWEAKPEEVREIARVGW